MIYLTTGTPGSFKTLSTIGRVFKYQQEQKKLGLDRTVYCANVNGIKIDGWQTFESGKNWISLPDGAIVVIDECQKEEQGFGRMSHTAKVPPHISELETHRHRGIDIFLITQGPHLINSHIKPLIDTHWHYVRKYGWDRAHVYTSTGIIKNPETKANLKDLEHSIYKPDKALFDKYHSATLHTVKKRVPKAVYLGIPALIVFAALMIVGVKTVQGLADDGASTPPLEQQPIEGSTVAASTVMPSNQASQQQPSFDPVMAYVPRLPHMPETAPAYDNLRKAADWPRPQCVASKTSCRCYTQQASLMVDYPQAICRQYVSDGYFDPTKAPQDSAAKLQGASAPSS